MKKTLAFSIPVLRTILFITAGLLLTVITKKTLLEMTRWWTILCSVVNVITIIILAVVLKYEGSSYRELLNYKKGQIKFKNTVIIVFSMLLVGIGGMYAFGYLIYGYMPTLLIQPVPVWLGIINVIVFPVTIIFAEMPIYFAYSINRIEKFSGSRVLAFSYCMFFYALQHSFIPLLFDWKYIVFKFLSFLPLMVVLSIIYNKKRNLAPLMIGHGIMDLATSSQILIMSLFPAVYIMIQQAS
ncbi:MAG: hypothetical protein JXQ23_00425 [Clostridia bacterium]|nr:hypothetical protein [Clostridia bacterium]